MFINFFKKTSLSKLQIGLLVWIVLSSLILTFIVPPLQKPDEYVHFERTIAIKNGFITCNDASAEYLMDDKYTNKVEDLVNSYSITQNYESKFDYHSFFRKPFEKDTNKSFKSASRICGLPFISYVFPALFLKLVDIVHLDAFYGFYMGRLANLLLFFGALFYIIKRCLAEKEEDLLSVILTVVGLPIFIHQVGSYSYDSLHLSLGLILITNTFLFSVKKEINLKSFISLVLLAFLFLMTKTGGYELFFILPLIPLINNRHLIQKKTFLTYFSAWLLVGLIYISLKFKYLATFTSPTSYTAGVHPDLQLNYILENPGVLINALVNSHKYVWESLSSLIGVLGWLDYKLTQLFYILYYSFLLYVIYKWSKSKRVKKLSNLQYLLLIIIGVGTYLFINVIMYLTWTKLGASSISGVQGRYFSLIILILAISSHFFYMLYKNHKRLFYSAFILYLTFLLGKSVFLRYYDYSHLYDDPVQAQFYEMSGEDFIYQLSLNSQKKLVGIKITFDDSNELGENSFPLEYFIFNEKCEKIIRKGIILTEDINYESKSVLLEFKKLQPSSNACLTIKSLRNPSVKEIIKSASLIYLR